MTPSLRNSSFRPGACVCTLPRLGLVVKEFEMFSFMLGIKLSFIGTLVTVLSLPFC